MSTTDPAWQEWAEKAAADAAWQAKCREMAGLYWRAHYAKQEARSQAGLRDQCENVASDHIRAFQAWEQHQLACRLADAVSKPDAIRQQVADLVRVAEQYLEQEHFSDTTKAWRVAGALMTLRDSMLSDQECQELDEAGMVVQQRVEELARELNDRENHQSQQPARKLSEADQEQEDVAVVTRAIMREIAKETQAHKSPARVRLYRLSDCIEEWRSWGTAPHDEGESVHNVARQLVPLVEHLGMAVPGQFAGGAT
jgi:hypothetical protein